MSVSRLSLAVDNGAFELPDQGRIAVFNPAADTVLSALDKARAHIIQGFYPDQEALNRRGFEVAAAPVGEYVAAVVFLPRAKAHARDLLAQAAAVIPKDGLLIIDGQKTDGIEPMLKALRARVDVVGSFSKAHGKLLWLSGGDFADWAAQDKHVEGDFITRPGVFSADGPDKGSLALNAALPAHLKGRGADLGAGWGFLSRAILERETVTSLDLIEADHTALECARRNISDPRARFHWGDARRWVPEESLNFIVTNPPFHTSRKGEPDLGRAFIRAAATMLTPAGELWLVANRHLPYEASLEATFRHVSDVGGTAGFKVLHAVRPRRKPLPMP